MKSWRCNFQYPLWVVNIGGSEDDKLSYSFIKLVLVDKNQKHGAIDHAMLQ